jgi:hypothetical protein
MQKRVVRVRAADNRDRIEIVATLKNSDGLSRDEVNAAANSLADKLMVIIPDVKHMGVRLSKVRVG